MEYRCISASATAAAGNISTDASFMSDQFKQFYMTHMSTVLRIMEMHGKLAEHNLQIPDCLQCFDAVG